MFFAILAAELNHLVFFVLVVIIVLSCKAVFALNTIGLGIWLIFFLKKRWMGFWAIILGLFWFMVTTQVIIPEFGVTNAEISRHLSRYRYLGNSFTEIFSNLILQPTIIFKAIFSTANIEYLVLLLIPIAWSISLK